VPGEHEERRLKGVLGVVQVAQDAPAQPQHHRPVPRHQDRERRLIALADEALQQDRIGSGVQRVPGEQLFQQPGSGGVMGGHVASFLTGDTVVSMIVPPRQATRTLICSAPVPAGITVRCSLASSDA
jgi:hypothetical protein